MLSRFTASVALCRLCFSVKKKNWCNEGCSLWDLCVKGRYEKEGGGGYVAHSASHEVLHEKNRASNRPRDQ